MDYRISRKVRKEGFTLVELLVVIAIIGVLIAVLLPSMQRAREVTQSAVCMSRQRSVGQLVQYYVNDYKTYLPSSSEPVVDPELPAQWFSKLGYYYLDVRLSTDPSDPNPRWGNGGGPERTFVCPSTPEVGRFGLHGQKNIGYGWNYLALTHLDFTVNPAGFWTARMSQIQVPSRTIVTGDSHIFNNLAYVIKPLNFAWWFNVDSYAPGYRHLTKGNFMFADGHVATYSEDENYYSDELWTMKKQ